MTELAIASALLWLATLLAPWRPWSTRERLEVPEAQDTPAESFDLSDVCVLIPARNEEDQIAETLDALNAQGNGLAIRVIDDRSDDATPLIVQKREFATLVKGQPLPKGWTGKLWALEQGRQENSRPLTLLLDADIRLRPGLLPLAKAQLIAGDLDMISLMADLRKDSVWEKLLMAPFVYFFKLLYPFHLSNKAGSRVAAAAGGFVLLRTQALEAIGGFSALQGAVIDDCTLAARLKSAGFRCWTGLTRAVVSERAYGTLGSIFDMVARTAYAQLKYSPLLLAVCTALMLLAFWAPLAAVGFGNSSAKWAGLTALLLMCACYLPTLRYYRLPAAWALSLPLAATLFLAMTWASAIRFWRGEQTRWKGRSYRDELKASKPGPRNSTD